LKKTLENGGSVLKDAQDKKELAQDSINDGIRKITSPLDKTQSQLDGALNKIDEPFEELENKQMQANMAVQASKEKAALRTGSRSSRTLVNWSRT
jgi:tyrosine-protein phosphatase YwqE